MNGSKVMHRSHDQANMVDVVCLDFIHIAHMKFVPHHFFLPTQNVISDVHLVF